MNGSQTVFFNTGHHTTEMFVPLHHFSRSGFDFDFATQEGNEIALEEWTFDLAVGYEDVTQAMRHSVSDRLATPQKFDNITNLDAYAAVFIPGGHGPVIDLHLHESLGRILRMAHDQELTTISLCHGPNALRSAALGGDFPYSGYKIRIFTDMAQGQTLKPHELRSCPFLQSVMLETVLYWLQWNWRRWSYGEALVGEFVMTFVHSSFQVAFVTQLFEARGGIYTVKQWSATWEVSQVARTRDTILKIANQKTVRNHFTKSCTRRSSKRTSA